MLGRYARSVCIVALLALTAALALAAPVFAGGWVVITLDALPEGIVAGETYTVGMMARQHGQRAWETESLHIEAEHVETGRAVVFTALPEGAPGHYVAELVFPLAGEWEWSIGAGLFPQAQPMPVLTVASEPALAAPPGAGAVTTPERGALTIALGVGALLAFVTGLLVILRARSRRLPLLGGTALMVLCAGLAFASYSSASAQGKQVVPATGEKSTPAEDLSAVGQQLFLAKGCIVCHNNERAIQSSESYSTNVAPDLTKYKNDPNYIHTKLKDPKAMNPAAQMPQLELKEYEIEALVAFINDHE